MTLAEVFPSMPLPYEECVGLAVVFPGSLVQSIVNAQAWRGNPQFRAPPIPLTDGRWFMPGALLSEAPVGLYGNAFAAIDPSGFAAAEIVEYANISSLRYGEGSAEPLPPTPEPEPEPEPPAE